jgi:hypothetical protein
MPNDKETINDIDVINIKVLNYTIFSCNVPGFIVLGLVAVVLMLCLHGCCATCKKCVSPPTRAQDIGKD